MKHYTFIRKKFLTPYIMVLAVIYISMSVGNYWILLGIPFIFLGWISSAPNFNLADGFLSFMSTIILFVLGSTLWKPLIFVGIICFTSWIVTSIESALRIEEIEIKDTEQ